MDGCDILANLATESHPLPSFGQWRIQDFQGGMKRWGRKPIILGFTPLNYMKNFKIGRRGGRASLASPLDPPLLSVGCLCPAKLVCCFYHHPKRGYLTSRKRRKFQYVIFGFKIWLLFSCIEMLMKIDSASTIKLITACQDNVGLRKAEIPC